MENEAFGSSGGMQYLTFNLADECYAVRVSSVEVVLEMAAITRVPNCSPHIRGVINHRGSVVPVVDLRVVFGLEEAELSEGTSVIISQIPYEGEILTAGILADAVQEVVDIEERLVEPPPAFGARIDGKFVQGIGKRGTDFIILLDLESALSVMAAKERK